MKIITKTLTRSDLHEIILRGDNVVLDLTLLNEFSAKEDPTAPLVDIQAEIEKLPVSLPQADKEDNAENELLFSRAYHLYLLLATLRNKTQIRAKVAQFLVQLINSGIKCSNYASKPYSILYSFYGENAASALIDSMSKLPALTPKEKDILLPQLENAYYFALSTVNLLKVQSVLSLGELSFSFFLEQNVIKSDFLHIKYEKRANNKFVSPTANNILNFVSGSKFNKVVPKSIITTWIDLAAQVKTVVTESLNSILEEVNTEAEENENLSDLKIKDENYNAKNSIFFQTQNLNLLTSLASLIANNFERLKEVKEVEKEIASVIEQYLAQFNQDKSGLLSALSGSFGGQTPGFGSQFGSVFQVTQFANILYGIVVAETLSAYRTLDALNQNLIQKTSKGKPGEESKDNKEKKVGRKIQPGKGTIQTLDRFDEDLFNQHDASLKNEDRVRLFTEYFSPLNFKLLDFIEEIISPKNNERRRPKIPKGTRDMDPPQMAIRRMAIDTIRGIFLKHGAVEIDTPVFELKETLTGKYGENSKLIYDLQDQGGEQLSLRYDLTVPFARYLATNPKGVTNMKRLHIAKVYRRDQPQIKKGRFREFYQCDYDIVGSYGLMIPDAECIMIMSEIFTTLGLGKVVIKVNNRKLLDAMIELSGAPMQKFKSICSSIDKLDKETWDDVRKELITEKGLSEAMVDKLGVFVQYKGSPVELVKRLTEENVFKGSVNGEAALNEMSVLFKYLHEVNCTENVLFDLSLARGLDYYTGIIYEAVLDDPTVGLGSIAGGGRYDELVGMFSNKGIPAVGLSIGIERVFGLLEKKYENDPTIRAVETEVLVGSIGSDQATERFKLCKYLWDANIKAEMLYNDNPKPQKQLQHALENYIPFILWIGEDEIKNNKVKIKCLYKGEEQEVKRDELIGKLKELLAIYQDEKAKGLLEFKKLEEKEKEKGKEKEKK